jgi:hypothetical protein
VLARWQEFVGTGEFTRNLEHRIGRIRDQIAAFLRGRPAPTEALEDALESSVEALLRAAADGAAERTAESWRHRPAGRALLKDGGDIRHASEGFREGAAREIRAWQGDVLQLVVAEGGEKRTRARLATFGANGAGLVLMLAVFAHTGGLTGAEVLVAGGTSAVSHKLLEAIFGDSAVRELATKARANLADRVEALLDAERARFGALVDAAAPQPGAAIRLRSALDAFEAERRANR